MGAALSRHYRAEELGVVAAGDDGAFGIGTKRTFNVPEGADDLLGEGGRDAVLRRPLQGNDKDLAVALDGEVFV